MATVVEDLRKTFLVRYRAKDPEMKIMDIPVNVNMPCDLDAGVVAAWDNIQLEKLRAIPEFDLSSATLSSLKAILHVPTAKLLGFLARIESIGWTPPEAEPEPGIEVDLDKSQETFFGPVEVTPELKEQATALLDSKYLDTVSKHDLRFQDFKINCELSKWLEVECAKIQSDTRLPAFIEQCNKHLEATAIEEVDDIIIHLVRHRISSRIPGEQRNRYRQIFRGRYIAATGTGKSLQELGEEMAITRERIRQICEKFEEILVDGKLAIATPALDKVLLMASRISPIDADTATREVGPYLGEGFGIESAVGWAKLLHRPSPVIADRVKTTIRYNTVDVVMIRKESEQPWFKPMFRHVSRDSSLLGCTNLLRVAGLLALEEGVAPGRESIVSALEASADFRWLDKDLGWFTYGDTTHCAASLRVRKILSLAQDSIGVDEVAGALAADDMWLYREERTLGLAVPPVHVLRELCRGWRGLDLVQKGRLVAVGVYTEDPLSESERIAADTIARYDGIASRYEISEAVRSAMNVTEMLVSNLLGSSPIFDKVELGHYRIRGRRPGDMALANARARTRLRLRKVTGTEVNGLNLAANEFLINITPASMGNEQFSVPTSFRREGLSGEVQVQSMQGEVLGAARINQSGALKGLHPLFPAAKAGDFYLVRYKGGSLIAVQHLQAG